VKNHWLDKKNEDAFTKDLRELNVQLTIENANLKEKIKLLEVEYNQKLEEAYECLSKEMAEAEKVAEQGYEEAYAIICDLRNQIEEMKKPRNTGPILKGFPPSNTISPSVKITDQDLSYKAPDDLEVRLYEEYEKKLKETKEFIVDRVDAFLKMEAEERDNILAARLRKNYTPQQIVDAALES